MKKHAAFVLAALIATGGLGVRSAIAMQPPAPPMGYQEPPPGWDAPPPEFQEVERKGFHDGIEGARKDAENHRRPDVYNRDEYKHPDVPHRDRKAYRRGFERGYQIGIDHLMHGRY